MQKQKKNSKLKMRLTIATMIFTGLALTSLSALITMGSYKL